MHKLLNAWCEPSNGKVAVRVILKFYAGTIVKGFCMITLSDPGSICCTHIFTKLLRQKEMSWSTWDIETCQANGCVIPEFIEKCQDDMTNSFDLEP